MQVTVTVSANPAPTISTLTPTYLYIVGAVGNHFAWNITDPFTGGTPTYIIDRNGTNLTNFIGWTSPANIPMNSTLLDGWFPGYYNVTVIANNGLGAIAQNQVNVTVNDYPAISTPPSIIYTYGSATPTLFWTATDAITATRTYTIYQNGTSVFSGNWINNTQFGYMLPGNLAAGYYNYSCNVSDSLGGTNSSWALVTVNDVPQLSQPGNQFFQAGQNGTPLEWTVTDSVNNGSQYYVIYQNSTPIASWNWTSGVPFGVPLNGLPANYYNYSCYVYDGFGGTTSNWVFVVVNDLPQLSPPNGYSYYWNQTGNTIFWTVSDTLNNASRYYVIDQGATFIAAGNWTAGTPIEVNVDNLLTGSYTYYCTVYDGYGGNAMSFWTVTVQAHQLLINPASTTVVAFSGTPGSTIKWTITDLATSSPTYEIYKDGILWVGATSFSSGQPVSFTVNDSVLGLLGSHTITIVASNGLGGTAQNQVTAVLDDIPQVTTPSGISFFLGQTGFSLNWTATKSSTYSALTYAITANGTQVASGSWTSAHPFIMGLDNLQAGTNNIVCTVSDGYGGTNSSSVTVTVIGHAPTFNKPTIGTIEAGKPITIAIVVTDSVAIDQVILSWSNDSGTTWHNVTMTLTPTSAQTAAGDTTLTWNCSGNIPPQGAGSNVLFQVFARDIYGVSTALTNGGQYFPIVIAGNGLPLWVWIAIIGAAAVGVIIMGALYVRSSQKKGSKTAKKRYVSKQLLAPAYTAKQETPATAETTTVEVPAAAISLLAEPEEKEEEPGVYTYRGGRIVGPRFIYKVKVKNSTEATITDVSIHLLSYPRDCMTLATEELRRVAKIAPHGFRSLEFELLPQKDCVEGNSCPRSVI